MKTVMLKDGIYEVGAVDWNVRNFHGYSTNRGASYNAYLIIDEKIALIDTVKNQFADELIKNISDIIDPMKIDYIVSNHAEPDHSGSLKEISNAAKNAKIVTSDPNGLKNLSAHYGKDFDFMTVKSGDVLSLGKRTLTFVQTPMLHWPDNMVTYCPEEKILFSNDAFGQHFATSGKFADENDKDIIFAEAKKYYANILMPFGVQTKKALEIVKQLDIDIIAPAHGVIFRKDPEWIIKQYEYFSDTTPENVAVVVYDSMWKSTDKMAYAIVDGFAKKGVTAKLYDLKVNHISDIMTEVLKAEYIAVGSPTLNNNMMPTVAALLTYMKGLAPKNKKAFAFGSYGWGGQSIGQVNDELVKCGFDIVLDPVKFQYVPTTEFLNELSDKVSSI